jgi:crotonobetainyl-CoA:carnitine CoA-transferase CaiB-like acyl-CoA transferase
MTELGNGALSGVRVADFTRVIAGPLASQILGDLGAEVIKVELPSVGDEARGYTAGRSTLSPVFMAFNRNKKSVGLDLRTDDGKAAARALVLSSDVLIHNFRPGVMERLGFGYDDLREEAPGLIYCSISGFGENSSLKNKAANDLISEAFGGVMSITGEPDGPPARCGASIGDETAALYAAIGILAALHRRSHDGLGQLVTTSLLESQLALLGYQYTDYWTTGHVPVRMGSATTLGLPNQAFQTADGWVVFAATGERMWRRCTTALGIPEAGDDARFATLDLRYAHRAELLEVVSAATHALTQDECIERLEAAGVACAPIHTIDQMANHPILDELDVVHEVSGPAGESVRVVGLPVHLSRTPPTVRCSPPILGSDTKEILAELGLSGLPTADSTPRHQPETAAG